MLSCFVSYLQSPDQALHVPGLCRPLGLLMGIASQRTFHLQVLETPGAEFLDLVKVLGLGSHVEPPLDFCFVIPILPPGASPPDPAVGHSVVGSK